MSSIFNKFITDRKVIQPTKSRDQRIIEATHYSKERIHTELASLGYYQPPEYIRNQLGENTSKRK